MEGYRRKAIKEMYPMCGEFENPKPFNLDGGETASWKMNFKCKKWLNYHDIFIIKKFSNFIIVSSSRTLEVTCSKQEENGRGI